MVLLKTIPFLPEGWSILKTEVNIIIIIIIISNSSVIFVIRKVVRK